MAIRLHDIRRTRGRVATTHLGRVAKIVSRGAAHLGARSELTLVVTARATIGVADSIVDELACRGIAAGAGRVASGITVLVAFDDTVSTHLQRDGVTGLVGINETGGISMGSSGAG